MTGQQASWAKSGLVTYELSRWADNGSEKELWKERRALEYVSYGDDLTLMIEISGVAMSRLFC